MAALSSSYHQHVKPSPAKKAKTEHVPEPHLPVSGITNAIMAPLFNEVFLMEGDRHFWTDEITTSWKKQFHNKVEHPTEKDKKGNPVKIIDIARQMIAMSGLREGTDIDIEFTGLQAGEKLFEEVQHLSETLEVTQHPCVMRLVAPNDTQINMSQISQDLKSAMINTNVAVIKGAIQKNIPEYTPSVEV